MTIPVEGVVRLPFMRSNKHSCTLNFSHDNQVLLLVSLLSPGSQGSLLPHLSSALLHPIYGLWETGNEDADVSRSKVW